MNPKLWLRMFGTRRLLWLGFGVLTLVIVSIGVIGILRFQSIATSFEKANNIAKPRASAGHELEINILGYSLNVWRYLSGSDAARQRAAKDAVGRGAAARWVCGAGRDRAATGTGGAAADRLAECLRVGRGADGGAHGESRGVGTLHGNSCPAGAVSRFRVAAGRGESQ